MSSIRARLVAAMLLTLLLVALLFGVATYRNVLRATEELFDYHLRQMALSLRDQGELDPAQAQALGDEDLDFVVQIWAADGRAVYASRLHPELPSRAVLGFADVAVGKRTWRTFGVISGGRVIQVAQPLQIREQQAARAALDSVAPIAVLAPLIAVVGWGLLSWAFRPLRRVARSVRERDVATLGPLSPAGLPDEVRPLVEALNGLLGRLDAAFGVQRAFVADAAHELRSPLTALKLQIESLRRADAAGDADGRAASIAGLSAGIERAARLVEQLLALARSEPGAAATPFVALDFGELVRQAVADTVPLALSRDMRFELDAEAGSAGTLNLRGDAAALQALVRNLADNAVCYAPPGSTISLCVAREADAIVLTVDDAGPGIPPAERERVFDRFVRRADGIPGTGLGLAIVRSVAERHGATVTLADAPAGGLRVRVRFPTPVAAAPPLGLVSNAGPAA